MFVGLPLGVHCIIVGCSMFIGCSWGCHWRFVGCSLDVRWMFVGVSFGISLFVGFPLGVHCIIVRCSMFIGCSWFFHWRFVGCSLDVRWMFVGVLKMSDWDIPMVGEAFADTAMLFDYLFVYPIPVECALPGRRNAGAGPSVNEVTTTAERFAPFT